MEHDDYNAVKALEHFYGFNKEAALILIAEYRKQDKIKDLIEFVYAKQRLSNKENGYG